MFSSEGQLTDCSTQVSRCGDIKYPPKKYPGGWFSVGMSLHGGI